MRFIRKKKKPLVIYLCTLIGELDRVMGNLYND